MITADVLWFELEARRACQVRGGNPKWSGLAGSGGDFRGDVVIDDGGPDLIGVICQRTHEQKYEGGDCCRCFDHGSILLRRAPSGREYTQKRAADCQERLCDRLRGLRGFRERSAR